jgi:hypothetical protein
MRIKPLFRDERFDVGSRDAAFEPAGLIVKPLQGAQFPQAHSSLTRRFSNTALSAPPAKVGHASPTCWMKRAPEVAIRHLAVTNLIAN